MAISGFWFMELNMFTINSGEDVPKATIVRPITILGILNLLAKDEEPSTRKFAPQISGINPNNIINK
nr:hypothetical protein [Propionigenium maris]